MTAKECSRGGAGPRSEAGLPAVKPGDPLLAVLERIADALEKSNEVAVMQCQSLDAIGDQLYQLKQA